MNINNEGRSSYLDLLITTLMEHEEKTDRLLEKLEKIVRNLSTTFEQTSLKPERIVIKEEGREEKSDSDTVIYVKINANRPLQEALKIIESLKK